MHTSSEHTVQNIFYYTTAAVATCERDMLEVAQTLSHFRFLHLLFFIIFFCFRYSTLFIFQLNCC